VKLDLGTFLLQWAAGGLLFLWVTTRRREVGLGYGWLLRGVFGAFAIGAIAVFATRGSDAHPTANSLALASSVAVVLATGAALAVSVVRRGAGVRGQVSERARRRARVAAMVGDSRLNTAETAAAVAAPPHEFPPALDLVAPALGAIGLLAAALLAGGPYPLAAVRLLIGAAFLGCVTDAMLLGHWYLVQPGLRRDPLQQLVVLCAVLWPVEVLAFLWPTGMVQVFNGTIDDGYNGLLAWVWLVSAVSTIALVGVTWLALRERYYSAVMAATGLLYLAILTAFGTDLIARAVLAP
jgi:hypothetical protein